MSFNTYTSRPWARFHDLKSNPIRPVGTRVTCFDSWIDLVEICKTSGVSRKFKAAGSHWSLSESTISDGDALETNWPGPESWERYSGNDDLNDLYSEPLFDFLVENPPNKAETLTADPCLQQRAAGPFYVHLKSGTRLYQAYSILDRVGAPAGSFADRLNRELGTRHAGAYDGPWALETMGGAAGQTLFGALTTGTHGGDYLQRPVSDSVVAVHLVTAGGNHFWIEPGTDRNELPIADDNKLWNKYSVVPDAQFSIIRDSTIFDSVVVSVGRFGAVASLVLRVVPQYCLHEHRNLENWSEVKRLLTNESLRHQFFGNVYFPTYQRAEAQNEFTRRFGVFDGVKNRFLQIAVNTSPHANNEHRCGITQRWFASHDSAEAKNPDGTIRGREERGTLLTAGTSYPFEPSDDPLKSGSSNGTFLQKACSNGNFIAGLLDQAADELQEIIDDGFVPATGIAVVALGVGAGAVALSIASICVVLAIIVAILREIADDIEAGGDISLTQVVNAVADRVLNNPDIPRPLGVMVIRMIYLLIFESEQSKRDFVAVSYAVMDTHDYQDRSCYGNAYSIEVFFDASRPDVYCTYVDQILAFEAAQQENEGRLTAGYISLRYVKGSNGLIAPSRFEDTVVIEVAGIRDAAGTVPFVNNAVALARHPQFAAPFHWGQFNPLDRDEVNRIFNAMPRPGALNLWRTALRSLTDNGFLDGFSSDFTRRTGLEP